MKKEAFKPYFKPWMRVISWLLIFTFLCQNAYAAKGSFDDYSSGELTAYDYATVANAFDKPGYDYSAVYSVDFCTVTPPVVPYYSAPAMPNYSVPVMPAFDVGNVVTTPLPVFEPATYTLPTPMSAAYPTSTTILEDLSGRSTPPRPGSILDSGGLAMLATQPPLGIANGISSANSLTPVSPTNIGNNSPLYNPLTRIDNNLFSAPPTSTLNSNSPLQTAGGTGSTQIAGGNGVSDGQLQSPPRPQGATGSLRSIEPLSGNITQASPASPALPMPRPTTEISESRSGSSAALTSPAAAVLPLIGLGGSIPIGMLFGATSQTPPPSSPSPSAPSLGPSALPPVQADIALATAPLDLVRPFPKTSEAVIRIPAPPSMTTRPLEEDKPGAGPSASLTAPVASPALTAPTTPTSPPISTQSPSLAALIPPPKTPEEPIWAQESRRPSSPPPLDWGSNIPQPASTPSPVAVAPTNSNLGQAATPRIEPVAAPTPAMSESLSRLPITLPEPKTPEELTPVPSTFSSPPPLDLNMPRPTANTQTTSPSVPALQLPPPRVAPQPSGLEAPRPQDMPRLPSTRAEFPTSPPPLDLNMPTVTIRLQAQRHFVPIVPIDRRISNLIDQIEGYRYFVRNIDGHAGRPSSQDGQDLSFYERSIPRLEEELSRLLQRSGNSLPEDLLRRARITLGLPEREGLVATLPNGERIRVIGPTGFLLTDSVTSRLTGIMGSAAMIPERLFPSPSSLQEELYMNSMAWRLFDDNFRPFPGLIPPSAYYQESAPRPEGQTSSLRHLYLAARADGSIVDTSMPSIPKPPPLVVQKALGSPRPSLRPRYVYESGGRSRLYNLGLQIRENSELYNLALQQYIDGLDSGPLRLLGNAYLTSLNTLGWQYTMPIELASRPLGESIEGYMRFAPDLLDHICRDPWGGTGRLLAISKPLSSFSRWLSGASPNNVQVGSPARGIRSALQSAASQVAHTAVTLGIAAGCDRIAELMGVRRGVVSSMVLTGFQAGRIGYNRLRAREIRRLAQQYNARVVYLNGTPIFILPRGQLLHNRNRSLFNRFMLRDAIIVSERSVEFHTQAARIRLSTGMDRLEEQYTARERAANRHYEVVRRTSGQEAADSELARALNQIREQRRSRYEQIHREFEDSSPNITIAVAEGHGEARGGQFYVSNIPANVLTNFLHQLLGINAVDLNSCNSDFFGRPGRLGPVPIPTIYPNGSAGSGLQNGHRYVVARGFNIQYPGNRHPLRFRTRLDAPALEEYLQTGELPLTPPSTLSPSTPSIGASGVGASAPYILRTPRRSVISASAGLPLPRSIREFDRYLRALEDARLPIFDVSANGDALYVGIENLPAGTDINADRMPSGLVVYTPRHATELYTPMPIIPEPTPGRLAGAFFIESSRPNFEGLIAYFHGLSLRGRHMVGETNVPAIQTVRFLPGRCGSRYRGGPIGLISCNREGARLGGRPSVPVVQAGSIVEQHGIESGIHGPILGEGVQNGATPWRLITPQGISRTYDPRALLQAARLYCPPEEVARWERFLERLEHR